MIQAPPLSGYLDTKTGEVYMKFDKWKTREESREIFGDATDTIFDKLERDLFTLLMANSHVDVKVLN